MPDNRTMTQIRKNVIAQGIASGERAKLELLQAERDRLRAVNAELLDALEVLTEHANETYPHFECHRGQVDIARARAAIAKAKE